MNQSQDPVTAQRERTLAGHLIAERGAPFSGTMRIVSTSASSVGSTVLVR
jgi:hypothetical protein